MDLVIKRKRKKRALTYPEGQDQMGRLDYHQSSGDREEVHGYGDLEE